MAAHSTPTLQNHFAAHVGAKWHAQKFDQNAKIVCPGYTRGEIWGIWSMAADEIRWGVEYQGENQKDDGLAGRRLTDSGYCFNGSHFLLGNSFALYQCDGC
jgi:hypothetical protein